jgi:hypothetical protein
MNTTTVHKFTRLHPQKGVRVTAERMATLQFIAKAKGKIIPGTGRDVDSVFVDADGQANISIQPLSRLQS